MKDGLLGVGNSEVENVFSLYPNPADDKIHIKLKEGITAQTIMIYDALGRMIQKSEFVETIDISSFQNGILFLQITTNQGTQTKKLIKR